MIYFSDSKAVLQGEIQLPYSKSISNRLLMLQAQAMEKLEIRHLSTANDTQLLQKLIGLRQHTDGLLRLDAEDAGTVYRFMTAWLAIQEGQMSFLDGHPRMYERPVSALVEALQSLGADIRYTGKSGYPPLQIHGTALIGSRIKIHSDVSSQFISALCLIAPFLKNGLVLDIHDQQVSRSYISMTLDCLKEVGIKVEESNHLIKIWPSKINVTHYTIEADWSSASFFYLMAMLRPGSSLKLLGLQSNSIQGDAALMNLARHFGVYSSPVEDGMLIRSEVIPQIENLFLDLSQMPDVALPLMLGCAILHPAVKFGGIAHLAYKESHRIQALAKELAKMGIELIENQGIYSFRKSVILPHGITMEFSSHNDHRMAMSLACLALIGLKIELDDWQCVRKSFPDFWNELHELGFDSVYI